jgi:hypothetical protein
MLIYAMEELLAEIGAAFLRRSGYHAAYITSWLLLLKNDKRAIFTCHAQKAADYLPRLPLSAVDDEHRAGFTGPFSINRTLRGFFEQRAQSLADVDNVELSGRGNKIRQ